MTNMRSDAKQTLKLWETKLTQEEHENAAKNLKSLGMGYIRKCLQSQNSSSAMK